MFVISVYGRAGQGVDSALAVLAKSAVATQLYAQSIFFPSQERRGPAVFGQVKIDKNNMLSKQIEDYDMALVLDSSLDIRNILGSGKERSAVIINSSEKFVSPLLKKKKMKSYFLNASDIALRTAAKPMPNMAVLGAFVKLYPKISLKSVRGFVEHNKDHLTALEEGYKAVR